MGNSVVYLLRYPNINANGINKNNKSDEIRSTGFPDISVKVKEKGAKSKIKLEYNIIARKISTHR
ncbi:hypothetical protein A6E08_08830 [Vibrio lentus]|nr:hypothetical protein A6E08_08830 [Vibrio lentus]